MAKNWQQTFNDITMLYPDKLRNFDSEMIETQQETIDATDEIVVDDDDDDSSDDDKSFHYTSKHRKGYSLFEDEENSDDPDRQNTLGKESGHEKKLKLIPKMQQPLTMTQLNQERQLIMTSAIYQIMSLQQQTNQTQQVTTKEPQITISR